MHKTPRFIRLAAALLCVCLFVAAAAGCSGQSGSAAASAPSAPAGSTAPGAGSGDTAPVILTDEPLVPTSEPNTYAALPLPQELRAVWISFLEWNNRDIATEEAMRAALTPMLDHCVDTGLNTVIVAVRAMGDALYNSAVYPWSHLITGTQGQDPGYDPLAVVLEEAHARGLRVEAMVNPYRVNHSALGPDTLAENHPANVHGEVVREVSGGLYLDPGQPAARQLIVDGVAEIVQNYDVDGIHFDDYFYPEGLTEDFDAETYAAYGEGAGMDAWRRENVNTLVRAVYQTVKAMNPAASFGISPQGNNENNFTTQYSDVKLWMASEGYVDYIMPQLYWGFGHVDAAGRDIAAFSNKCLEWSGYGRHNSVRLFAGLGAYRIGLLQPDGTRADFGGNGAGDQAEWESGHAMADQVEYLRQSGFTGFALFRYDYFFQPDDTVSASEVAALKAVLQPAEENSATGTSSVSSGDAGNAGE